jgi:hypothetical protein
MPVSRRKATSNISVPKEAKDLQLPYCCYCQRNRPISKFLPTTNPFLYRSGYSITCIDCNVEIYNKIYSAEGSMEKTILKMCRMLDCRYDDRAVQTTKRQIENSNKNIENVWGIYRKNLVKVDGITNALSAENMDLTYVEPIVYMSEPLSEEDFDRATINELQEFWGSGFTEEEYQFLERKLVEWKNSYSCNNKGEEFYLKEACHKELDLRRARAGTGQGSVDAILKSMDTLMKSAALTPAQANAASAGRVGDTLGMLYKRIISTSPAEYYKDKELFKDYDNLGLYCRNYIYRPIWNFFTGNKNYELVDADQSIDDDNSN